MSYNSPSRPKEQLQVLEANCTLVDILYNKKLDNEWVVTISSDNNSKTVKGSSYIEVLDKAENVVLNEWE